MFVEAQLFTAAPLYCKNFGRSVSKIGMAVKNGICTEGDQGEAEMSAD